MKKTIKACIFFVRLPIPIYRKIMIETCVPKEWDKGQIEERITNIAYMCNNEITKETIKKINFKEVKK